VLDAPISILSRHSEKKYGQLGAVVFRHWITSQHFPASTKCPLCPLFAIMRPKPERLTESESISYCLHAYSSVKTYAIDWDSYKLASAPDAKDTNFLAVIYRDHCRHEAPRYLQGRHPAQTSVRKTGYLCSADSSESPSGNCFQARRISPTAIDFNVLRSWMNFCCKYHKKACVIPNVLRVPLLRVVDCERYIIIPAPALCHY
jgi:hypothetical protein